MDKKDRKRKFKAEEELEQANEDARRDAREIEPDLDAEELFGDDDETVVFILTGSEEDDDEDSPTIDPDEALDFLAIEAGVLDDEIMEHLDDFTDDEDVLADFDERQHLAATGQDLQEKLRQHLSRSPQLTGDDIDAAWDNIDVSGEEGVGGSAPTPDQDVVDDLGEAFGLRYDDEEPLNTDEKFEERDRNRWELDPASAGIEADEEFDEEEGAEEEEDDETGIEDIDLEDEI